MRFSTDLMSLYLRFLIVSSLVLFIAFPSELKAQSNEESDVNISETLELLDRNSKAFEALGHCHFGLDCFVAALIVHAPQLGVQYLEADANFAFVNHENDSWKHAFDPPPPRIRS